MFFEDPYMYPTTLLYMQVLINFSILKLEVETYKLLDKKKIIVMKIKFK